jgi:hypothetical protein
VKKKVKERVKSATRHALDLFNSGSPSKKPGLFRLWGKPKVLTEEEKRTAFRGDLEEGRSKAEFREKQVRLQAAAKEKQRKDSQNERQQRSRAKRAAAEEARNPGGKKRRKVSKWHSNIN